MSFLGSTATLHEGSLFRGETNASRSDVMGQNVGKRTVCGRWNYWQTDVVVLCQPEDVPAAAEAKPHGRSALSGELE